MSQSPLAIESYFIPHFHFDLKDEFAKQIQTVTPNAPGPNVNVTSNIVRSADEPNRFRVELIISGGAAEKDFPYSVELSVVGFFRVADDYPADQVELLAHVNGPSVLYSAAREFLMTVTGRSGYPPILLQSVSFVPRPAEQAPTKAKAKPTAKKPVIAKVAKSKAIRKK